MNERMIARVVGALFLFSNVVFLIGAMMFVEPVIGAKDPLIAADVLGRGVAVGVILEILNGIAYILIGVLMYVPLKARFGGWALAYPAIRIGEFATQLLCAIFPLLLISYAAVQVEHSSAEAGAVAATLIKGRFWSFQLLGLCLSASTILLNLMFFFSRLLPRFLSVWGFIGGIGMLTATVSDMLGLGLPSITVVLFGYELFLGVWLIAKGFSRQEKD